MRKSKEKTNGWPYMGVEKIKISASSDQHTNNISTIVICSSGERSSPLYKQTRRIIREALQRRKKRRRGEANIHICCIEVYFSVFFSCQDGLDALQPFHMIITTKYQSRHLQQQNHNVAPKKDKQRKERGSTKT
jgi:hypothetical protein